MYNNNRRLNKKEREEEQSFFKEKSVIYLIKIAYDQYLQQKQ